jgi:hypothetical protein
MAVDNYSRKGWISGVLTHYFAFEEARKMLADTMKKDIWNIVDRWKIVCIIDLGYI